MITYNFISQAHAEEAPQVASVSHTVASTNIASASEGSLIANLAPLLAIMAVFYFLLIRPQQKKLREHQTLVKSLKRGNKVMTMSGVLGVIIDDHDDNYVALEIAKDVVIQIKRESIGEVLSEPKKEEKANTKTIKPTVVRVKKEHKKSKNA
ncbi:MAG: preprotein translocase subunit YajC [Proteobacteria bacterium]|nr:preprotein translocase subunit YajC [Pseudomonadota bacterium]